MQRDSDLGRLLKDPVYKYEVLDEVLKLQRQMEITISIMAMLLALLFLIMAIKISPYFLVGSILSCLSTSNIVVRKIARRSMDNDVDF
jgi:hypothetical protein